MFSIQRAALYSALLLTVHHTAWADLNPFGAANEYNIFALSNTIHHGGDSEGRVAIGGNANLKSFGVGNKLSTSTQTGLVVGGDLNFSNGEVSVGDIHVAGIATTSSVGIPKGNLQTPSTPIDFSVEKTYLQNLSTYWASLPSTGNVKIESWGGVTLTGAETDVNIFTLSAAQWKASRQITVNVPSGASSIINIAGISDTIPADHLWFGTMTADKNKTVWNFHEATELNIQSTSWQGTLFAPFAHFTYKSGNQEGHLIVDTLTATNYSAEAHWYRFTGDLPVPPTETAQACTPQIYGIQDTGLNDSQFFSLDITSSVTTALGESYAGYDIEGIDADLSTGILYASSGDDVDSTQIHGQVYTFDPTAQVLNRLPNPTGFGEVSAISVHPTTNELWGWADGEGLILIDKATGIASAVLASPARIEGLTWNAEGTVLYGTANHQLWSFTPDAVVNKVALVCDNLVHETEALDTLPDGNLLLTAHGVSNVSFATAIDPESCTVLSSSHVNTPYNDIEGITWTCDE